MHPLPVRDPLRIEHVSEAEKGIGDALRSDPLSAETGQWPGVRLRSSTLPSSATRVSNRG